MLHNAHKIYGGKVPRATLEKQLFPSSSPAAVNGDIRDQWSRKDAARGALDSKTAVVSTSARTTDSSTILGPISTNALNATNRDVNTSRLNTLYGKSSFDSSAFIDLTKEENATQGVEFSEDDFSDDDHLDLDFQAPAALLQDHTPQLTKLPTSSTRSAVDIPWSSSPLAHWHPPQQTRHESMPYDLNAPDLQSSASSASESTLKRLSTDDAEVQITEPPLPAKRRKLPSTFRQNKTVEEEVASRVQTPAAKSKYYDPSASAIKEAKERRKNNARKPAAEHEASVDEVTLDVAQNPPPPSQIHLSQEQEHVRELVVERRESVFFTGPAGTGKSVLMRAIIKDLKAKYARSPERVAVTASTGLAACNIGGTTLHSFAGIGAGKGEVASLVRKIRQNAKAKERWLKTNCLIIDEISMLDGELFDNLDRIARLLRNSGKPWGGIQLILTGDFFQLPPVPDKGRKSTFAFDAVCWDTSLNHTIGLSQIFRQRDPEFAKMLNEVRLGKISEETVKAFKALSRPLKFNDGVDMAELFPTRAQVDYANNARLKCLPGEAHQFEADDAGNPAILDKMMAPKSLTLKLHAQVMLIKNLDDTLVNGSLGKVVAFSDEGTYNMETTNDDAEDSMTKARRKLKAFERQGSEPPAKKERKFPVVQFTSTTGTPRTILCIPEDWKVELPTGEVQARRSQIPLILAWALSIHKAQGQTLDRVRVDLQKTFTEGQAYVALSRATTKEGLRVDNFERFKVKASDRVAEFYKKLYSVEHAMRKKPATIDSFVKKVPA